MLNEWIDAVRSLNLPAAGACLLATAVDDYVAVFVCAKPHFAPSARGVVRP